MPVIPRIELTKLFTYEGGGKEWTNTYYFDGDVPADFSAWDDMAVAVSNQEKLILQNDVTIVKARGWNDTDEFPVFTESLEIVGTLSVSGASNAPRDCCAICRFDTGVRDSRNHPVYGYKYWHGVADYDSGSGHPAGWLYEPQKTAMETYATWWCNGTGGWTLLTSGGHPCLSYFVDPWIRHRDFPR